MLIEKTFIVPSYYKHFICKAGACRHTCCEGLSINITQDEYHRLVGLDCSSELREKLDLALYVLSHPDEYKYACISPTYTGHCRMLSENGLCQLQQECGAEVLTSVCKYFPRHPHLTTPPVCSMANACEATLELFLNAEDWSYEELPLIFLLAGREPENADSASATVKGSISFQTSAALEKNRELKDSTSQETVPLHLSLPSLMAKSSLSMTSRLEKIRETLEATSAGKTPTASLTANVSGYNKNMAVLHTSHKMSLPVIYVQTQALSELLHATGAEYPDLTLPARRAEEYILYLVQHGKVFNEQALDAALQELETHFTKLNIPLNFSSFYAKAFANGMFYHSFPFGAKQSATALHHAGTNSKNYACSAEQLANAMTILTYTVYLLTVLLIASKDCLTNADSLIDLVAAFSRMTDLSDFDKRVLAAHSTDFPGGISA